MEHQDELSLQELFAVLRRGLVLALGAAVAAAGGTFLLTRRMAPTHEATATLLASQPDPGLNSFGVSLVSAPRVDVTAYRAAARSYPVLADALVRLGHPDPTPQMVRAFEGRLRVRIESAQASSLILLQVQSEDPAAATSDANALAEALMAWDKRRATLNLRQIRRTIESQIEALDQQIRAQATGADPSPAALDGRIALREERRQQLYYARALETSAIGRLEILEPAVRPLSPIAPSPLRNGALAAMVAVFLVYALVLLREALDTRLRSTEDIARVTELPVLAEFGRQATGMRRLPREATTYLRTNLLFAAAGDHPKIIVVTSAGADQGKSSVALSLAESFARSEHRTLLIDADLRKPVIGGEYNLDRSHVAPLQAHLQNPLNDLLIPACIELGGGIELDVVPSFEPAPNPTELLSAGFAGFLRQQAEHYDAIVIDSAPVLPVADTLTIAPHATGTVFAVSLPNTDRRNARAAVDLLRRIGVRLLGAVATNLEGERSRSGEYGYGYGYGYGAREAATTAVAYPSASIPHERSVT